MKIITLVLGFVLMVSVCVLFLPDIIHKFKLFWNKLIKELRSKEIQGEGKWANT